MNKKKFSDTKKQVSFLRHRLANDIDDDLLKKNIKSFGFQNFKIFKNHNSIDIGQLNVLEGENGAGKSSVYEVLKILAQSFQDTESTIDVLNTSGILKKWNQSSDLIYNNNSKNDLSFDFDIIRDFNFYKLGNGPKYDIKKNLDTKFALDWIEKNSIMIMRIMNSNPVSYYILWLFVKDLCDENGIFKSLKDYPRSELDIRTFKEKLLQNITVGRKIQKDFKTYFRERKIDLTIIANFDKRKRKTYSWNKKSLYLKSDINKLTYIHLDEAMSKFQGDIEKLNDSIKFEVKGLLDLTNINFGSTTTHKTKTTDIVYTLNVPNRNISQFNNEIIKQQKSDYNNYKDESLRKFDLLPFIIKCIETEKIDKTIKISKIKTFNDVIKKVIGEPKEITDEKQYYEYSLDLKVKLYFESIPTNTVEELRVSGMTLTNNVTNQKLIEFMTPSRINKKEKDFWKKLLKSKKYRMEDDLKYFIDLAKDQKQLIINNLFSDNDSSNFWKILKYFYDNLSYEGFDAFLPPNLANDDIKSGNDLHNLCAVNNVALNYTLINNGFHFYEVLKSYDNINIDSTIQNPSMVFDKIISRLQLQLNGELNFDLERRYRGKISSSTAGVRFLMNKYLSSINSFIRSTMFIDNVSFSGEEQNYSYSVQKNNLISQPSGSGKEFTIDNILTYCYQNPNTLKILNEWLKKIKLNFKIEIIKVSQAPFILRGTVTDTTSKVKNIDLNHIGFGAYQAIRLIFILISFENKSIF